MLTLIGRRREESREPRSGAAADLLVVGLGNPGPEFVHTRHNAGAEVVQVLAGRHGAHLRHERGLRATAGTVRVGGRVLALAVPALLFAWAYQRTRVQAKDPHALGLGTRTPRGWCY